MWNNIGRKLQSLAKVLCWLGIIVSLISAIILWNQNSYYQSTILAGILRLVTGCLASWIGSWAMYGLGLVVEHVENGGALSGQVVSSALTAIAQEAEDKKKLAAGGWRCECGRVNNNYITRCACGKNKNDVLYGGSSGE